VLDAGLGNEGLEVRTDVHYTKMDPVTHARMALAHPKMGNDIQVSAQGGFSAFGKHSEFTKPVLEFTKGMAKDEELQSMYEGMKGSNPLRTLDGHQPVGAPFAGVPSLATLKATIHARIAEVWGPHGYVVLRQHLFDCGDHEGFVSKDNVKMVFQDQLGLGPDALDHRALNAYLDQLITMKKTEMKISSLLGSLRPALAQKEKRRVMEVFKSLQPTNGSVKLGDWLSRLSDTELRKTIVTAFGAESEESVLDVSITESVFQELLSDLAPLMDITALLA